jgi:glycosyltransferase involved in cell wall biosynthesis
VEQLPKGIPIFYFSTGTYWGFHEAQEKKRINYLFERRGINLYPDRPILASEEWANSRADTIICLGNEFVRETYGKFQNVLSLNNASYPDNAFEQFSKDYQDARRHFLFFAGAGSLHKGLDLLLEVFAREHNLHLHVCQAIHPEFYASYRHELEELPNIHTYGHIPARSSKFYNLMRQCGFVILPSASEGCAGSVVECMHQGLIPVVSRETSILTEKDNFGIMLNNCRIETIQATVQDLSGCSSDWCKEMSLQTRQVALTEFSEATFRSNLSMILRYSIQ